ncbi:putative nicotinamide n-methyltransferase protein [Lasiodiplodia theobromae]|uniref:Protein-lysine N-methyltransferase EFM6 n=2 Tax=Lasiodiplodia theobromae TaxID=45133 RepID=A0A5N5DCD7_9PEZI|nr:Protein-lysine N-methyltransferase EFM6 [Lasiodiplodia theobromae]KAF9637375.1 putative nicotinamide n-methyltransferase protein [Lasiodiplodia theobromae]
MADDDGFLASFSEDFVQLPQYKAAGTSSIDFDGLLSSPLKLHEDLKGGCGGQLWPAGMVLSRYLLRQHKHDLNGRSIIELGAGGGLVGLAVALGCDLSASEKHPLYITDQEPMFALMQQNTALNDLSARVKPLIYDWGSAPPALLPVPPDVILAADCVYFEPAFPLLQKTLEDLIGPDTVCYFCFKKRRRADMHFVKAIKKTFDVQVVEDDPDKDVYGRENIFLFKITQRKN